VVEPTVTESAVTDLAVTDLAVTDLVVVKPAVAGLAGEPAEVQSTRRLAEVTEIIEVAEPVEVGLVVVELPEVELV
jgi:hypothetical protein